MVVIYLHFFILIIRWSFSVFALPTRKKRKNEKKRALHDYVELPTAVLQMSVIQASFPWLSEVNQSLFSAVALARDCQHGWNSIF